MNIENKVLTSDELKKLDAYFRTANYLSACQLYLKDNPLLKEPLKLEHIKAYVVGHWGTVPGQNFIYLHLNRLIKNHDLNMIYLSGPGHGGNAMVANTYMEGTYSEVYPNITEDEAGLKKLFKQFSFPGGISSHVAPETPGSINEGGELGYSLSHAFGAVLDNPDLIAACVVGDGEAETGPLAASWHANKMLNKKKDGTVLPILHLNGYKIANPTVFARIPEEELISFFQGCGWNPHIVTYSDMTTVHEDMAKALEDCYSEIDRIKNSSSEERAIFPMIVLKTPKGWTGPKEIDGKQIEDSSRAHQVPILVNKEQEQNVILLENWLRSYRPEELFDEEGKILKDIKELAPTGVHRMGSNPHANGGLLLKELRLPDFREYGIDVNNPGSVMEQDMSILGRYVRGIIEANDDNNNFRIFGPDELESNRLNAVFDSTSRQWQGEIKDTDQNITTSGRVVDSFLSEHLCEGFLEGYLLTGRHGFFHCYEAFIRIIDSMASQHAKWLKVVDQLPWRRDIASLNLILSSHIWQQDHNGYTHQNPGFLNHIISHKANVVRAYLPPDANCLLSCFNHVIKSKNYINVIVASKHPRPQWLSMEEAVKHCTAGIGIWEFASNDKGENPDVIMACCGDTPTLEVLAAVKLLRENFSDLKVRVVNVVDLMRLQSDSEHPHGLNDDDYNKLFTKDKPIIFAFHGYPNLIHQLTYRRENQNLHVHGYVEEGTITTPFDMRVQNGIDRFNLVLSALKYLPELENKGSFLYQWCKDKLVEHKEFIKENGQDLREIVNWKWED